MTRQNAQTFPCRAYTNHSTTEADAVISCNFAHKLPAAPVTHDVEALDFLVFFYLLFCKQPF